MERRDQRLQVGHRTHGFVHGEVIGNIVAVIHLWGDEDRVQPHRVDAEGLQVRDPLPDPVQVPDAVAVAVLKRFWIDLVNNCVFIPSAHNHPSFLLQPYEKRPATTSAQALLPLSKTWGALGGRLRPRCGRAGLRFGVGLGCAAGLRLLGSDLEALML